MENQDKIDQYLEEHRKLLNDLARWAINYPDMLDELRGAMMASLALMGNYEPVEGFHDIVKDAEAFIKSCQTGDINPENFIINNKEADDDVNS